MPPVSDTTAAPARRATLRDVAERAGVSRAVASRALSGHSSVAAETRDRVRAAAQALGYRASVLARALSSGRNAPLRCAVVGLGLPLEVLGASFYGPVLAGLASEASEQAMDVHLVAIPGAGSERSEALRRLAAEDRADGFIVLSFLELTPEHLAPLTDTGIPYVVVNRHFEHIGGPAVHCVTLDWQRAAEDALDRLVALGHRRMVLLLPEGDRSTVWDQIQGWQRGAAAHGVRRDAAPVWRYAPEELPTRIDALVAQSAQRAEDGAAAPTAVVCFNDHTAFLVLQAAAARGVGVPAQLSVIGFDNRIGDYTTPPLCSYDGRLLEMGRAAARLMGAVLRGEQQTPLRVTPEARFVCRGSCGRAPS